MQQKILIVEDDFAIRNSVEYALKREGYEVLSLDTGDGALEALASFKPDLLLLDVMLPGVTGHQILEKLRESDHSLAVIMMSALGEPEDRIAGLKIGADDYVTKPFSLEELIMRVQANLRRSGMHGQHSASLQQEETDTKKVIKLVTTDDSVPVELNSMKRVALVAGNKIALRAKEFDLLFALGSRAGDVLTRQQLSEEVWGYDHMQSSRTIDVHIRRLRSLFAAEGAHTVLRTVHGVGYTLDASEDVSADGNRADA
jgi:DNA-binding response OmpR family regulator